VLGSEKNLSIVIPTAMESDLFACCVERIREHTKGSYEIVAVCNSPDDRFHKRVDEALAGKEDYVVIDEHQYMGYGPACNRGAAESSGRYICVINDDILLGESDWDGKIIRSFEEDSSLAIVGPFVFYLDSGGHRIFAYKKNRYVEGSFIVIPRHIYEQFGLYDEEMKIGYCEDSDLSLRIQRAGYKIQRVPLRLKHIGQRSVHPLSFKLPIGAASEKNRQRLVERWNLNAMKTFKHSGARGDLIYSLPTIRCLGGGILYISTEPLEPKYHTTHRFTDDDVEQFRELLSGQPYLTDIRKWKGEEIDYNLDTFRDTPARSIVEAHLNIFNVRNFDPMTSWLDGISGLPVADVVIQKSLRWNDKEDLSWHLLREYQNRCVFVGFEDEHQRFISATGLMNIQRYECKTYLELARVIKGSRLFIGNQSFGFALAEAMKHPRVLEVYYQMANCSPNGRNGHTALTEEILEAYLGDSHRGLSIIVSSYNQKNRLELAMESYKNQNVLPREVIIADDGSTDGTVEWLRSVPDNTYPFPVICIAREHDGYRLASLNNLAASRASFERLLFTNADLVHCPTSVEAHLSLDDKEIGGGCFIGVKESVVTSFTREAVVDFSTFKEIADKNRSDYNNLEFVRYCNPNVNFYGIWGGNFSIARSQFYELGGYDEGYDVGWGGEESDLVLRALKSGLQCVWVPKSSGYHLDHPRGKYADEQKGRQKFWAEHNYEEEAKRLYQTQQPVVPTYDSKLPVKKKEVLDGRVAITGSLTIRKSR
jgi:GT2 family glycosyltransferase